MSYVVTQESFDSLAYCWADSSHRLRWSSIFVLPAWLKVWWQEFGSGSELYLGAVRQREEIIGIAPLQTLTWVGPAGSKAIKALLGNSVVHRSELQCSIFGILEST